MIDGKEECVSWETKLKKIGPLNTMLNTVNCALTGQCCKNKLILPKAVLISWLKKKSLWTDFDKQVFNKNWIISKIIRWVEQWAETSPQSRKAAVSPLN